MAISLRTRPTTSRWLVTLALALGCTPGPATGTDAGASADAPVGAGLTVVPTGATTSATIDGEVGGTLTLTTAEHTYTLEVTPGALSTDTEITLEEVTVVELPGALAVRFSPDGLVFRVPALLSVDAPYDEPMLALAFRAGEPGVEMAFAAPHEDGLAMQVAHFSEAAFVPADAADAALDVEQAAEAAAVTDRSRSQAFGLGTILRGRVSLLVDDAHLRVVELELAARALGDARAEMTLGSLENLNAGSFGPPTVLELVTDLVARLEADALRLHTNLTAPSCAGTDDIAALSDWARAVHRLRAAMMRLAITLPEAALCVSSRLTVTSSPDHLEATTDEVVLSRVALELVGPGTVPEVALVGETLFTFVPTGADGPLDRLAPTGAATDLHYTRPAGAARTPLVTIVVNGHTTDTMLGGLPAPAPVTVSVGEATTFAGAVTVGSSCRTISSTTILCSGGPEGAEVIDSAEYAVGGTLRVTLAGDAVTVEATDLTATRRTDHDVDENHFPLVLTTLVGTPTITGSRDADGRVRARICGPSEVYRRTVDDVCIGSSIEMTTTAEHCWDVVFVPTPAGDPTTLVPEPTTLGCGSEIPSTSGVLTRE